MKVKIDNLRIAGIAAVVPKRIVSLDNYSTIFGEKKIKRIKRSIGIDSVRVVDKGVTASDLCYEAAQKLIQEMKVDVSSIDAIIFSSISPDYKAPATSIILQDRLGLSKDVVAMDLTFGCSGFVYGLYQAAVLIKAGGCNRVLLCAGDTQSLMVNEKDRAMKMLVGDAGTATIVELGDDSFSFVLGCDGSGYQDLIIPAGGYRMPSNEETRIEVEDQDGNIRTAENLYMNGMEVMKFALTAVPMAINQLLEQVSLKKEDISLFAMHQPNKMILDSLAMTMGVEQDIMPVGLGNTGNTASASIPLLLTKLASEGFNFQNSDNIVTCGFGIGLSIGTCLISLKESKVFPVIEYT